MIDLSGPLLRDSLRVLVELKAGRTISPEYLDDLIGRIIHYQCTNKVAQIVSGSLGDLILEDDPESGC